MKQLLSMESLRITSILVLLFTCSVSSFPSRPLNERSTDLTWQAWLLVDDQNQEKNYDTESLGRRRITPKSVFIAPTFSPESLPPCASGYQSDSMGRCVKLIEINQEAHLAYLLEKLNERFGGYDDFSEQESPPSGPLQLNIPLDETPPSGEVDEEEEDVDVAIVVAPTNGNFNLDDEKRSKKDDQAGPVEKQNVGNSSHEGLTLKSGNSLPVDVPTSSSIPLTPPTEVTETPVRTPTTESTPEASTTESVQEPTTTQRIQQALFFREPDEIGSEDPDHAEPGREDNAEGAPLTGEPADRETTTEILSTAFKPHHAKQTSPAYQEPEPTDAPVSKNYVRFPTRRPIRFPVEEVAVGDDVSSSTSLKSLYHHSFPEQDTPGNSRQPGENLREPGDSSRQPGDSSRRPGENYRQPGDTSRQPEHNPREHASDARQSDDSRHSGGSSRRPGDNVRQPEYSLWQPGISTRYFDNYFRQPGDISRHPEGNSRHPEDNSRHPEDDSHHPDDNSRHPGDNSRHPGDNSRHPGDNSRHPGDNSRHPGDNSRHPGDNSRHPGDNSQHPGDGSRHSGDISRHPGDNFRQPGDNSRHPGDNLRIYADQFKHMSTTERYIRPETTPEPEFVFGNRDPEADATFRRSLGVQRRIRERSVNCSESQGNCDVKPGPVWPLSQALNESSPHKPLVLRFPRRHGSRRLLSASVLQPAAGGSYRTIYREMSPQDLKLIFGNSGRRRRKSDR